MKKRLFSLALLLCILLTLFPLQVFAEVEEATVEDAVVEEVTADEPVVEEVAAEEPVVEEAALDKVFAEVLAPEEEVVEVTVVNEPEDEAFVADLATDGHDETIPQEEAMIEVIAAAEASDEALAVDATAEEKTVFEDSVAEETLAPTDAMAAPGFEMEASGTDVPTLRGDTPITSVIVTITPPLAGQNPDRNPTIPSDTIYQAPLAKWLDTNGNTIKQDEVFEAGQTYTVYIMVQPCNGYYFPEIPAVCKINDHSNCGYSVSMDSSIGKNSLIMSTSFVAKNAINTASILITKPAVGAKPDYNPTLQSTVGCTTGSYTNGYYYKNDVIWYDKTTRGFLMPDQDVFLPGHEYNVRINLLAEDGFTFTDSTSGTINGNPISEFINYPSGMVHTNGVPVGAFEYDFPALPDAGWKKDSKGWWYQRSDGTYPKNQWEKIDGKWYHFDASGYMQTGWLKLSGKWYYLESSGAMVTGWQKISNKWYYFNAGGDMVTGWQKISGKWYYFESSGAMVTGWKQLGGKWYYFEGSGAMLTGWQKISNKWYFFNSGGDMLTGWLKWNNKWYYFDSSGAMLANTTKTIGGKSYHFDANGVCTNP